jgi:hypothetical protein
MAVLRRQVAGDHAQRAGGNAELLAPPYAHPAQYDGARGWLTWEAEAGRGKRSRLTFLYTGLALQQQRAEDLLEQDRIDQLVQLVGDKAAVRQMLVSHLGRSFRQGGISARALLPSDEKFAARQRAAAFGNPYGPANLQRPDAGK